MASAGASDGFFRCIYEGCLSGRDTGIERRPYHRDCGCALHSNKFKNNHHVRGLPPKCKTTVSYPMRRSYSEGSLLVLAAASSPRVQLGSCHELDDDHHNIVSFNKV